MVANQKKVLLFSKYPQRECWFISILFISNVFPELEVAEKLGVAQAQYARWENGGRNPKDETVEKLAEIFGTSFEFLKGRDDGLEEIVSLLREYELTETDKNKIINTLKDLLNKSK